MATSTRTPYQSQVEDFIRTAEANGHNGWAHLSSAHPAIRENHWSQLRKISLGVLAFYRDELGNMVELRYVNGSTVVVQYDPRRPYYIHLRGTGTGFIVRAECFDDAWALATKQLGIQRSSHIVVSLKPAKDVVFAN